MIMYVLYVQCTIDLKVETVSFKFNPPYTPGNKKVKFETIKPKNKFITNQKEQNGLSHAFLVFLSST